jgi:hypothetical protein
VLVRYTCHTRRELALSRPRHCQFSVAIDLDMRRTGVMAQLWSLLGLTIHSDEAPHETASALLHRAAATAMSGYQDAPGTETCSKSSAQPLGQRRHPQALRQPIQLPPPCLRQ